MDNQPEPTPSNQPQNPYSQPEPTPQPVPTPTPEQAQVPVDPTVTPPAAPQPVYTEPAAITPPTLETPAAPNLPLPVEPEAPATATVLPSPQVQQPVLDPTVSSNPITPKNRSKRKWLISLIIIILIILIGGGILYWHSQQNTPDKVFKASLETALSTKQVQQSAQADGSGAIVNYDLTNVKDPRLSTALTINLFGVTISAAGYGTLQNTYFEYTKIDSGSSGATASTTSARLTDDTDTQSALSPVLNKWAQLRKNGTLDSSIDPTTAEFSDPRYNVFGQYIFGNFSASDRASLVNYLLQNNVYAYNSKKVTSDTVDGHKVFAYNVTLNIAKLKEYNEKVAAIVGVSANDSLFKAALNDLTSTKTATMYIDKSTKQLVEVKTSQGGITATDTYSDYNDITLSAQPTPQLSFTQLTTLLNQLSGGDSSTDQ